MVRVAQLAMAAGLRDPARLTTAVAVATAESGLNPAKLGDVALQDDKWGPSVGLWQIRSLKAEKGKGTTRDQTKLTDPAFNAKAMMEISGGGSNWGPWSVTHPSDPAGYLRYQAARPGAAVAASAALTAGGVVDAKDTVTDAADSVGQLAAVVSDAAQTPIRVFNWLTDGKTWVRIGYFTAGFVLLVGGGLAIAKKPVMGVVTPVAKALLPTGKASAVAKTAQAVPTVN